MTGSPSKLMKAALKQTVVPALNALGFDGHNAEFRRVRGDALDFVSVLFDKPGRSFVLEAGSMPRGDFQAPWGDTVTEDKLSIEYVDERVRLLRESGRWFVFAGFGDDAEPYQQLAQEVADLLGQLQHWLEHGEAGPNVEVEEF